MNKIVYAIGILFICGVLYLLWDNTRFTIKTYEYKNPKVPTGMDGLRILQISDLHNQSFGKDNCRLLTAIADCKADVIMITGDLVDSTFTRPDKALAFAKELVKFAPVYYCTGNHEHRMEPKALKNFLSQLSNMGVKVLHDEAIPFRGGTLVGIKDPHSKKHTLRHLLRKTESSDFVLLLAHKPHYFHNYLEADLILTGHAHGGQMRLPWIGGVFAPGQGYFPKYTKGFYEMEGSTMLVSGGVGNSHRIPRVFNPPELVLLTLRSQ